ncbi:hypothetical protein O1D97_03860 [Marinomonas sp. 15G1-11]|uniref:Uncharacterized protein n=1 Tax=Marinomonas phaeophyticola TaxID=3004091 RepID=A0ABT4JR01_9GAMM|nr:hypothetical protein [Marinomonas sp. 15G1-11]MCZ2720800.1 hypothetical protein [Marinomonas sp. 15G1-11]
MLSILVIIGILIVIAGGLLFIIETFKMSIIWGIACLIISPISLVFVFLHWDVSKRPVFIQLVGLVFILFGVMAGAS